MRGGIEVNPEYCAIAEARLSQDVLQLETCAMRPNEMKLTFDASIKLDQRAPKNGWAHGGYINLCVRCNALFMGAKLATKCADCAYKDAK